MESKSGTVPRRLKAAVRRANRAGFFFVNIGANDGVSNDYIYPFLREFEWHGLAIEPVEAMFTELSKNYARFSRVTLEQTAIADNPRPFYFLKAKVGYNRPWTKQVGSLSREVLQNTIDVMRTWEFDGPVPADLEEAIVAVEVPCVRFNDLMQKHNVQAIDFLSIDTEGSDYEIFCSIDFSRYRPRILVIETGQMDENQRRDLARRLRDLDLHFLARLDVLTEAFVENGLMPRDHLSAAIRAIGDRLRGVLRPRLP